MAERRLAATAVASARAGMVWTPVAATPWDCIPFCLSSRMHNRSRKVNAVSHATGLAAAVDVDVAQFKQAARRFASGVTGAPIIRNCLAYFDCQVAAQIESGDHTLFIGLVQAVDASDGEPLVYFDGAYRTTTYAP